MGYDSMAKAVIRQNRCFNQEDALVVISGRLFGWHSHMGFTYNPNINIVTHLPSALPGIV